MTDLWRLSVAEAAASFRNGSLTVTALVDAQLARIPAHNPPV